MKEKRNNIRITQKARNDIINIYEFLKKNYGECYAKQIENKICKKILLLKDYAYLGRITEYEEILYRKIRKIVVDKFNIYYEFDARNKTIKILRIICFYIDKKNYYLA